MDPTHEHADGDGNCIDPMRSIERLRSGQLYAGQADGGSGGAGARSSAGDVDATRASLLAPASLARMLSGRRRVSWAEDVRRVDSACSTGDDEMEG